MSNAPDRRSPTGLTMIRLDELSKHFQGQQAPAVDRFSLEVPEGEIVILVGPSGCGKTTTMKTVNPSSSRRPDASSSTTRMSRGATVPRLLGWNKSRLDELLEVVHMPPGEYRGRYPKELSGVSFRT